MAGLVSRRASARALRQLTHALLLLQSMTYCFSLHSAFFTCRHGYERQLIDELCHAGISPSEISSPVAALVRVGDDALTRVHGRLIDPAYALQALPHATEVHGASVKALVEASHAQLTAEQRFTRWMEGAPRGALRVHAIVPDMLKGGRTPRLQRRCEAIAAGVEAQLRKRYPCVRQRREGDAAVTEECGGQLLLLQLLLLSPETLVVSLGRCDDVGLGTWPNWHVRAGLAQVDVTDEPMPSSAYRKLGEALACMQHWPSPADTVVDLGACPGGWTKALRRLGCAVIAVDRSPLDELLMGDNGVTFIKGDAFRYTPPWAEGEMDLGTKEGEAYPWMVSDVIAFPERAVELVQRWASVRWAHTMVITMKFQGDQVDWDAIREAQTEAHRVGYSFRAKHFFANKNEVTLMLQLNTASLR
ncbi:hypothetical protein AB1Y20_003230 [Prymnesium parvum]|uniref:Ribosomal RNA methyltransferase FtsJ domain-containing protein n=1 Tax=Prymnesium parvum TaxID=97485 RepID=A0AB34JBC0_PRYPA